ncbi:MAG: beta-lactamase [Parcubacteria group bacterium Gr01-1014_48]|nr:MAG: beta-lactamase [Parcubacteria group bacterium Greene0416_14]TSC74273.1 MAG: beta-lactamase [Parcubacteria group bacterium Gr01-1014_48]TSD01370.1 MAG: beta-lactamase [Parcubacteria group bacterium Greene1014_15]
MNKSWFTIEKINEKTFAISEYGHWEKVHSYLFIGSDKSALIDTGLGIANIKNEIDKLTNQEVIVITTHNHWDHIGGHSLFKEVAVHKNDLEWMEKGLPISVEQIRNTLISKPFTQELPREFNIEKYIPFTGIPQQILKDLDEIDLGNRGLKILHTPGHSPGHICVYEEATGYLATGDLLYKGMLYVFYPSTNPALFAESIEKLCRLPKISKLLPGHYDLNIPVHYLFEARDAFNKLREANQLRQGTGVHEFKCISIRL